MSRTKAEIKADIKVLRHLKHSVPKYDEWGTNNHTLISAQYQTLRYDLTMDDIRRQYPDTSDTMGEAQGAAEDALYWAEGGKILSPSEKWKTGRQTPPGSA